MIIDFHTHVFPPRIKEKREQVLKAEPLFATLYSRPSARIATAPEVIASMEKDGVDVSVILNIGWGGLELCRETNDYILESVARYPGRLAGFCALMPGGGEEALKELERCARGGARGVGELRELGDEKAMGPIVEVMRQQGLILLLHTSEPVGHQYPGKGGLTPGLLYPFISRFPEVTLVCAHWGGGLPFYALMPEVTQALKNTYFDTAASPFLYRPAIYGLVAQLVGEDKLLFGSDFPLMPQARPLAEIQALPLPAPTKSLILGGNAQRLLGK